MRIIAVDIGNSAIKISVDGAESQILSLEPLGFNDFCRQLPELPFHWRIASVNQSTTGELQRLIETQRATDIVGLLQVEQLPIVADIDNPHSAGIDRLAAAAAAAHLYDRRPSIVIDAGTAITIDLIEPPNRFRGGTILPGLSLQLAALGAGTDGLPIVSVDAGEPPPLIGRNTTAAIQSGVFWGTVGSIREIVARMQAAHSVGRIYLTGGAGPALQPHLGMKIQMEPDLVLQGIRLARSRATRQQDPDRQENKGQENK